MDCVYHIRQISNKNLSEGYIGVTNDFKRRKNQHFSELLKCCHGNNKLQESFNKNNLEMIPIMFGDEEYCYEIENKLRPKYDMALNIAVGGYLMGASSKKNMEQRIERGKHPVHVAMKKGDTSKFCFFSDENKKKTSIRNSKLFKGTVTVTDKNGKSMRISKEEFSFQKIGPTEDWKYVGVGSNESKIRRGVSNGS